MLMYWVSSLIRDGIMKSGYHALVRGQSRRVVLSRALSVAYDENDLGSQNKTSQRALPSLLKKTKRWACVENCGACCYLKPNEREELDDWLSPQDRELYESMVGADGWCIHYDQKARLCTIYEDRPDFCKVEANTFENMYGVPEEDLDTFCTSCCREHIADVYGISSYEMRRFNGALKSLRRQSALEQKARDKEEAIRLAESLSSSFFPSTSKSNPRDSLNISTNSSPT